MQAAASGTTGPMPFGGPPIIPASRRARHERSGEVGRGITVTLRRPRDRPPPLRTNANLDIAAVTRVRPMKRLLLLLAFIGAATLAIRQLKSS